MALSQKQKDTAFEITVNILKCFCNGGSNKETPDILVTNLFNAICTLAEDNNLFE